MARATVRTRPGHGIQNWDALHRAASWRLIGVISAGGQANGEIAAELFVQRRGPRQDPLNHVFTKLAAAQ